MYEPAPKLQAPAESTPWPADPRFAGILRASVPAERAADLERALNALAAQGLRVVVEQSEQDEPEGSFRGFRLELVGTDRAGIIRDISRALASRAVNVDELHTECSSAPMSGETLFHARARLRVPTDSGIDELRAAIEEIANDLMVDISLSDADDDGDRPGR